MSALNSTSAPGLLFVAARRGIGTGALAAACAARAARAGCKAALADFRRQPHPVIAAAVAGTPPFRASRSGGGLPFLVDEIAIALGEATHFADETRPGAAAIVFTYAERDLAAARLAAERMRQASTQFVCVAAHTSPHFPFLPILRARAAKSLGDVRVIEAPVFSSEDLTAEALTGEPCQDLALAQTIDKLAKLAGVEQVEDAGGNGVGGGEIGRSGMDGRMGGRGGSVPLPEGDLSATFAAARRELADIV